MKKIILLILSLSIAFFAISCVSQDTGTTNNTESTTPSALPQEPPVPTAFPQEIGVREGWLAATLKTHVNPSLEALVNTDYSMYSGLSIPRGCLSQGHNTDIDSLGYYPVIELIEYVGMTSDDRAYVIMKLVRDDGTATYVYRFFKGFVGPEMDGERLEYWHTDNCEVYYASNSLSYKEFDAAFSVGDNMEQAIAVSPGLAFDLDMRYDYRSKYAPERAETVTQTCHVLLEDGVLVLRFESTCSTDEWEAQGKPDSLLVCTAMEFYPNGKPATVDGIELSVLTAPADKRPPLPQTPPTAN